MIKKIYNGNENLFEKLRILTESKENREFKKLRIAPKCKKEIPGFKPTPKERIMEITLKSKNKIEIRNKKGKEFFFFENKKDIQLIENSLNIKLDEEIK